MAIRLTRVPVCSEPSRSRDRASGDHNGRGASWSRPRPGRRRCASRRRGADRNFAETQLPSSPSARSVRRRSGAAQMPSACAFCLRDRLQLDDAAGVDGAARPSRQLSRPAAARGRRCSAPPAPGGRGLRGSRRPDLGAGPCSASSHSVGPPKSSPSRSRAVTSATTTWGRVPGWCSFLRRCSTRPSSASSRSIVLRAARCPSRWRARAISRAACHCGR